LKVVSTDPWPLGTAPWPLGTAPKPLCIIVLTPPSTVIRSPHF